GGDRIAAGIKKAAGFAIEVAADLRAEQSHCADGVKTLIQQDAAGNLDAVGSQRFAVAAEERASLAIEIAADIRAEQTHASLHRATGPQENARFDFHSVGRDPTGATA